ncbi:cold-shock protein [Enterococcus faecium]|nr:cold-shock protein [Enterococcus faecium]PQC26511.1 cold-shock protein [Enterococcus faecium]
MAKETEDKLAKLAKESGNDFKKLDEMEKEFKLNESPDVERDDREESKLEKTLDKAPIFPPNTPNNPTNPGALRILDSFNREEMVCGTIE